MGEGHTPGVRVIFGLKPANATLRFRVLFGEVVVEITNVAPLRVSG
jgi:hypothetical protein